MSFNMRQTCGRQCVIVGRLQHDFEAACLPQAYELDRDRSDAQDKQSPTWQVKATDRCCFARVVRCDITAAFHAQRYGECGSTRSDSLVSMESSASSVTSTSNMRSMALLQGRTTSR